MYYQNCYKLIGINLSRQTNKIIPKQINFMEKLEENNGGSKRFSKKLNPKKISNLLNEANNSKFVTRKWDIVNDQSNANYALRNYLLHRSTKI